MAQTKFQLSQAELKKRKQERLSARKPTENTGGFKVGTVGSPTSVLGQRRARRDAQREDATIPTQTSAPLAPAQDFATKKKTREAKIAERERLVDTPTIRTDVERTQRILGEFGAGEEAQRLAGLSTGEQRFEERIAEEERRKSAGKEVTDIEKSIQERNLQEFVRQSERSKKGVSAQLAEGTEGVTTSTAPLLAQEFKQNVNKRTQLAIDRVRSSNLRAAELERQAERARQAGRAETASGLIEQANLAKAQAADFERQAAVQVQEDQDRAFDIIGQLQESGSLAGMSQEEIGQLQPLLSALPEGVADSLIRAGISTSRSAQEAAQLTIQKDSLKSFTDFAKQGISIPPTMLQDFANKSGIPVEELMSFNQRAEQIFNDKALDQAEKILQIGQEEEKLKNLQQGFITDEAKDIKAFLQLDAAGAFDSFTPDERERIKKEKFGITSSNDPSARIKESEAQIKANNAIISSATIGTEVTKAILENQKLRTGIVTAQSQAQIKANEAIISGATLPAQIQKALLQNQQLAVNVATDRLELKELGIGGAQFGDISDTATFISGKNPRLSSGGSAQGAGSSGTKLENNPSKFLQNIDFGAETNGTIVNVGGEEIRVVQGFGSTASGEKGGHGAFDFSTKSRKDPNAPDKGGMVPSFQNGQIVKKGIASNFGGFVWIRDDQGNVFQYAHLDTDDIEGLNVGDSVSEGENFIHAENERSKWGVGSGEHLDLRLVGQQEGQAVIAPEISNRVDLLGLDTKEVKDLQSQLKGKTTEQVDAIIRSREIPIFESSIKEPIKVFRNKTEPHDEIENTMARLLPQIEKFKQSPDSVDLNTFDQLIGVSFNKLLDPGSVVRESEFNRLAGFQSLKGQIGGAIESLAVGGSKLDDAGRRGVIKAIEDMLEGSKKRKKSILSETLISTKSLGVPDDFVRSRLGIESSEEQDNLNLARAGADFLANLNVFDDDKNELASIFE